MVLKISSWTSWDGWIISIFQNTAGREAVTHATHYSNYRKTSNLMLVLEPSSSNWKSSQVDVSYSVHLVRCRAPIYLFIYTLCFPWTNAPLNSGLAFWTPRGPHLWVAAVWSGGSSVLWVLRLPRSLRNLGHLWNSFFLSAPELLASLGIK